MFFTIFIYALDVGVECTRSKFDDDTKLGREADEQSFCSLSSTQGSAKSCTLGGIYLCRSSFWSSTCWKAALQERSKLYMRQLNMRWQRVLAAKKTSRLLGCIRGSVMNMTRQVTLFPLLVRPHLGYHILFSSSSPVQERHGRTQESPT